MSAEVVGEMDWICGDRMPISFGTESESGTLLIEKASEGVDGYKLCPSSSGSKKDRERKEGTVCSCSIQFTPEPWHIRAIFPRHIQSMNPKFDYQQNSVLVYAKQPAE